MTNWNHNNHYHNYILKHLPTNKSLALDIGSGDGEFSYKLSKRFQQVICLEPDLNSFNYTKKVYQSTNIKPLNSLLADFDHEERTFDFIVCIASIHHMDMETSLNKMKSLLKNGGKIVILGLYRESSMVDLLISLCAIIPNILMNKRSKHKSGYQFDIKTAPALLTIKEIKKVLTRSLGSFTFKRHLFWRYSVVYENTIN